MINYIIIYNDGLNISIAKHDMQLYIKENKKNNLLTSQKGDTFYGDNITITWLNINKRNLDKLIDKLSNEGEEVKIINIDVLKHESPIIDSKYNEKSKRYKLFEKIMYDIKKIYGTELMYYYRIEEDFSFSIKEKEVFKLDIENMPYIYSTKEIAEEKAIEELNNKRLYYKKIVEEINEKLKNIDKSLNLINK